MNRAALLLRMYESTSADEKQLRKFIVEYTHKIAVCDTLIAAAKTEISQQRTKGESALTSAHIARAENSARRQAYVQAIADFKACLGEI